MSDRIYLRFRKRQFVSYTLGRGISQTIHSTFHTCGLCAEPWPRRYPESAARTGNEAWEGVWKARKGFSADRRRPDRRRNGDGHPRQVGRISVPSGRQPSAENVGRTVASGRYSVAINVQKDLSTVLNRAECSKGGSASQRGGPSYPQHLLASNLRFPQYPQILNHFTRVPHITSDQRKWDYRTDVRLSVEAWLCKAPAATEPSAQAAEIVFDTLSGTRI